MPDRETGRLLLEAEAVTLAASGTVARLAGIYGPHRSMILSKFLAGQSVIEEDGRRILNQIHRDDAARAILHLVTRARQGGVYNVSDSTPLSQLECHRALAAMFQPAASATRAASADGPTSASPTPNCAPPIGRRAFRRSSTPPRTSRAVSGKTRKSRFDPARPCIIRICDGGPSGPSRENVPPSGARPARDRKGLPPPGRRSPWDEPTP